MTATPSPAALSQKTEKRNYWALLFEGGFFICAIGFVNAQTLLPALIIEEGGPAWVAAFMPGIMIIGMFGVPILTAGWIDRLRRMKPFALTTGFFQRFIYIPVGLILAFGNPSPEWTVVLLAATPLLSGIIGGIGFSAWQRLYMSALPPERRASNLSYRFLFGGITGIAAGYIIERTLSAYPGQFGYGLLHLFAAFFFWCSWLMLLRVKETVPEPSPTEVRVPRRGVPAVLKEYYARGPLQRSRLCFLVSLVVMHAYMLVAPFYAVTLLHRLDAPKYFLGVLAMWQMGGQALGNLLAAWIGDRWGGRSTFGFGLLMITLVMIPAVLASSPGQAQFAYAAFGFSQMMMIVGKDTVLMELSPTRGQAGYLSTMALATMLSILLFSGVSHFFWTLEGGFTTLVVLTASLSFAGFIALSWVEDPRDKVRISPLQAIRRGILRYIR